MRRPRAGRVTLPMTLALALGCTRETTVAPTLAVTCSATPASGLAPLFVTFIVNVAGAEGSFSVAISYGDGASGTDVAAPHTYAGAGTYTATFTVRSATQSALCTTAVSVGAPPPSPSPPPAENQPPVPVFKTTPAAGPGNLIAGPAPFDVRFNLCDSSDPEQDVLYFSMDFQGDGAFDTGGTTGAQCRRTFSYPVGSYQPRICVTDLGPDHVPAHPYQCARYTVRAGP
jgi:hypothetical protein